MKHKKSKHVRYDDPSAFYQRFPVIREVTGEVRTALSLLYTNEKTFKMGKIMAARLSPSEETPGYFLSVRGRDRYPTWDEIVWLRYNLIPDAAIMSLLLPNLNAYINEEQTDFRFIFTLEQKGWAIDPPPTCPSCKANMVHQSSHLTLAQFKCPECGHAQEIDMTCWNEEHGNGLKAK